MIFVSQPRVRLQRDLAQSRNDASVTAASYEVAVLSYLPPVQHVPREVGPNTERLSRPARHNDSPVDPASAFLQPTARPT